MSNKVTLMSKKILIALAVFFLLLLLFFVKTMHDAGQFKKIEPHFAGKVRVIEGITGGEDITIDHHKQIAYISADDRYARMVKKKDGFGGIYKLDLTNPEAIPVLLQRTPDLPLYPHGISLYHTPEGKSYLYVVNHPGNSHTILLYSIQLDESLFLEKSWDNHDFIISPNDVLAVDENRFYFTNDHGSRSEFGKMLEDFLQLKRSNVVYFDGSNFQIAAKKIAYANGINMNAEKKEVYVASPVGKSILVYHRNASDGQLTYYKIIPLNTGPDNIEIDENGNLWTGCHPQLLSFLKHASDTSKLSPSQVIKIRKDEKGDFHPEEILLDSGELLSGSSVAAVSGNILLIGPVFQNRILRCELPEEN